MNIIYAAPYREGSGYANAAISNILALSTQNINLAARPIIFSSLKESPNILSKFEEVYFSHSDVIIQHCPPYSMEYVKEGGLNVGVFYAETDNLCLSWITRLNLMDINIVPNNQLKQQLLSVPAYKKPVEVVPIPTDINKYNKQYQITKQISEFRQKKKFLFYTMGEYAKRKNLSGLLKSYFSEFSQFEPVGLIIKTSINEMDADESLHLINEEINLIKMGMKLQFTPEILIITERLDEESLMSIHQHSDCFVQPSCAESWSIPAFEAMCFGKYPIVTDEGGYKEYIDESVGFLIPSRKTMVFGEGQIHSELFTSKSNWNEPDLYILKEKMREVYNNMDILEVAKKNAINKRVEFSYENIGSLLVKVVEKHGKSKRNNKL